MSVEKEWQTDGGIAMDYWEFDAFEYLPIVRWVNMARNFALFTVGEEHAILTDTKIVL